MSKKSSDEILVQTLKQEVHIFESLYLKEQTKSYWLIGICAALTVALIFALATSPFADESDPEVLAAAAPIAAQAQFGGGLPGGGLGAGTINVESFFLSDGSLDTQSLEVFEAVPEQFKSIFLDRVDDLIDDAVRDDQITAQQADELYNALSDL